MSLSISILQNNKQKHSTCQYCMKTYNGVDAVVRHCIVAHPEKNVSFLWPLINANGQLIKYKPRMFDVKGNQIDCDINDITAIGNLFVQYEC